MTISPLEFAREFAALKSKIRQKHAADTQLLSLSAFWPRLATLRDNQSYRSYFDEYYAIFTDLLTTADFSDCPPEELTTISVVADEIGSDESHTIKKALIRQHGYLGEIQEAVNVALTLTGETVTSVEGLTGPDLRSELERLQSVIEIVRDKAPRTADLLQQIATEWEAASGHLWFDRARCLFVESDGSAQSRGRMRTFVGTVERLEDKRRDRKEHQPDEVVFENQVKSPDDPFIGVVYNSLAAVRNLLSHAEGRKKADHVALRARYEIAESKQIVTGDSIGLASALIAYAQLLRPEILRYDRFVSSEVAFTGSIASDGRLLPVNPDSLATKLRRAYCSPIRYLVIPKACIERAELILAELRQQYPHRRLQLIVAENFRDVVEDRNIVRTERVCIGQFVGRKASKWTRTTKVQVPLLVVLLYMLVCVIYPKAWVGFDWQVADVVYEGERFAAVNAEGKSVWRSEKYGFDLPPDSNSNEGKFVAKSYLVTDIDNDGKNEIFFSTADVVSTNGSHLQLFDHDGVVLWKRPSFVQTAYPGDRGYSEVALNQAYNHAFLLPWADKDGTNCCLSICGASSPMRSQFILWGPESEPRDCYLFPGSVNFARLGRLDCDGDREEELFFCGTNNRYNRAAVFVLDPSKLNGVSPPWDEHHFLASGMPKGGQAYYVAFPETRLSEGEGIRNSASNILIDPTSRNMSVAVLEGLNLAVEDSVLDPKYCPVLYYTLDSLFIPQTCAFLEGDDVLMNRLLIKSGQMPIADFNQLYRDLTNDVIVYHGDSIVHHKSAGIDYYAR